MDKIIDKLINWKEVFIKNIPNIAIAIIVLFISYFVSRAIFSFIEKSIEKKIKQKSVRDLIARFSSAFIFLVGLYLAMTILKFDDTLKTIISAAGVSGIVVGLALQGTLTNTISGVVLSFRKNLNIGDWVETTGYAGEVVDINLNYFVIKELDNNRVVIPNKTILENPFKNYSLAKQMRVVIECGVAYDTNLEKVKSLTINTLKNKFSGEKTNKETEFFFTEFGDSSINFVCRFWINTKTVKKRLIAKSEALIAIKKAFDKEGITIPFPIRTLEFSNKLNLQNSEMEYAE